ncbi:polyphenol oxidase family protein [Pedococcus sp. 5OH_020]|uniref:polyphenol oxidase family protein n=1 Tax=Pedococcus sp. 5OH_020 TaxID=2989814 RepID=UPI0022E9A729|nr:polyphenol oxidase family protein [Pedococcus sp. 5OH_020]
MFYWQNRTGPVVWAFTDRDAADGRAQFGSLNLGSHVGDDPHRVQANRERVARALGMDPARLLFMDQHHGRDVAVVDGPCNDGDSAPAVDALVTATPGLALAALVADCTPVLLADVAAGVVGAVHAGRPGMTLRVVDEAVSRMRDLGARSITSVVGPSICGRCYEVPEELRSQAAAVSPVSATVSWRGTPAVDVAAGVVSQLVAQGVAVRWVAGCAREDARLYSYRRDGRTGRFAGIVALGLPGGPDAT